MESGLNRRRSHPRSALLLTLLAACACRFGGFRLSGSVTASSRLQERFDRPNTVLLIVAVNAGGVPVAVKRIVNPRLPLDFQMTNADLILPGDSWRGPLNIRVHINQHGTLGNPQKGDLRGGHRGLAESGDDSVDIVVDEEI